MTVNNSHPVRLYVLGLGCERGASADEVSTLALRAVKCAGIEVGDLAAIASIDSRLEEPAITGIAAALGISPVFFSAARLEEETHRILNPSEIVFARVGCHGVAEAAALAAAGASAELVVPKMKSAHATAAIARILLQNE